ncbi:MAG TPA: hypothetical protein ENK19_06070, partial [Acidobacteria bacterium]|nr:hypothetical protein [Acidobacteriota bacterium]
MGPGEPLRIEVPAGGRAEYALDGGVMRPIEGEVRAPQRGEHWLALVTRDALGAVSPVRWIQLIVDSESPQCQLSLDPAPVEHPAGELWVRPGTTVSLRAIDALSGPSSAELSVDGSVAASGASTASTTLEREGRTRIGGVCRDDAGNRSTAKEVKLTVDGTPPRGSLRLAGSQVERGDLLVAAPDVRAEAQWSDDLSGVATTAIARDGTWQEGEHLEGRWQEGEHRVEARASDWAGNEATARTLAFVVDATPPSLSCSPESAASDSGGGVAWVPKGTVLRCTAEDTPAGVKKVEVSADGVAWSPAGETIALTAGGVHVRATDGVGNVVRIVPPYRIDATPPSLEVVAPGGTRQDTGEIVLRRGEAVTVRAKDDGSGVARVEYRIDGGRWSPVQRRVVFRDTGTFEMEIRAVD